MKLTTDFELPWETWTLRRDSYGKYRFYTPESELNPVYIIANTAKQLADRILTEVRKRVKKGRKG